MVRVVAVASSLALGGCARDDDPCAIGVPVTTIDAVLDGIAGLPAPVTLECVLTSLERPIGLELTSDVFNTQPAQGPESPRIFLRSDTLTLTVVPVGEAANLLEFGEVHASGTTVKAELAFPLEEPFDPAAAFDILASPGAASTGCQVCHFTEIDLGDGRFASNELRPPDGMTVPLEVLFDERVACDDDRDADPVRCGMFSAVLDHGDVVHAPWADSVQTRFGP